MRSKRTAARRLLLRKLILEGEVTTQEELVDALGRAGHEVTQTTVSRDLSALEATKVRRDGNEIYVLPDSRTPAGSARLGRVMKEFVIEVESSGNLVVLKTPPGGAGPVAAALDAARLEGQLGCIGGDDTVLVIAREELGGPALARKLEGILENET